MPDLAHKIIDAEYDEVAAATGDLEPRATNSAEARPVFELLGLSDRPWAMTRPRLRSLVTAAGQLDLESVAARAGTPLENGNGARTHNGTAVLDIRGPLFRYRSIWTWLLGGTSVEQTSLALHAAVDDPGVQRIVLAINSPGGQIDGINELANMIRAANQIKPVTAYVDGLAASGAYWLASAAGRVVADETAQLGSIGVLATVIDDRGADERRGVKRFEIVSSQSPLKRSDPATDEGRAQLQDMVDTLAKLFIEKVAAFRGTVPAKVQRDFGQGALISAGAAVTLGMADDIGSLEGLLRTEAAPEIRKIRDQPGLRVKAAAPFDEEELEEETDEEQVNDDSNCLDPDAECNGDEDDEEDDEADDESEGTEQKPDESSIPKGGGDLIKPTEERQRIAAILTCEEARGREELARALALETNHTVEAAKKLLAASPTAASPKGNSLEARMSKIQNPKVGVQGEAPEEDSPAVEVQRILAFVPKERKRMQVQ
jgi:signal peptide peptidase SppA